LLSFCRSLQVHPIEWGMSMKTHQHSLIASLFVMLIFPSLIFGGWSPKVKLSQGATKASLNENMATCLAASGDTLHVVYSDKRASGTVIYYTRSIDTGLTWSFPVAITDLTKN